MFHTHLAATRASFTPARLVGRVSAPGAPSAEEGRLVAGMNAATTMTHITKLAAVPRDWGSVAYDEALAYITAQLAGTGWSVRVEELPTRMGKPVKNLVAFRKGTDPDATRKLVVAGAHLDSVRRGPGANDNASGSATLLELAKQLDAIPTRNDVKLVWFDGEEAGLFGSSAHVGANTADADRTIAMVNMDMVGSQNGIVGYDLGYKTPNALGDAIEGVRLRNKLGGKLRDEKHNRSDHAPFDRAGIPVVDFGVGVRTVDKEDPFYHRPTDTPDKINPAVLENFGDLIAITVWELANRTSRVG